MVDVVYTDEFGDWYLGLDKADQEAVDHIVGLLEARGVKLGYPHSSSLKGTKHPLRELRKQSQGKPLRLSTLSTLDDRLYYSSEATIQVTTLSTIG